MTAEKLVVVGQGYVGLPVAIRAVEQGFDVIGVDLDRERIRALSQGVSFVEDISDARVRSAIDSGRYTPTHDYGPAADFDIAVISVPTPLKDGVPDLSFVESAGRSLAAHLRPAATVILESTTYPGTTEQLLAPLLEAGSDLHVGTDFHLGYSPERIDPGNPTWRLENTPKVVSGVDDASLAAVTRFFEAIVDTVVPVSSVRAAELTKLLENTFRHVNIALVNELAIFANALSVDIWEAVRAASSKPFGFLSFTPGPGVGGHCLPIDPTYLSWQVRRDLGRPFRFVELANDVNDHMPDYVVQRAGEMLNRDRKAVNGSRILLLGLAYKKNTSDVRESPSVRVANLVAGLGAEVRVADSHVDLSVAHLSEPLNATQVELTADEVASADLTILLVDHDAFDHQLLSEARVLDTRHVLGARDGVEFL